MNCGMKLVKYLLFAFNLIFFLFGIALIAVGAYVEIKYRSVTIATGSALSTAPILVICVGIFIFFVSFFGCCGAYKENHCMVATFAGLMGIIFILEIAAAITAYVLRGKIDKTIQKTFTKSIKEYNPENAKLFNVIQEEFHCCGSYNYTSWSESKNFQNIAEATVTNNSIENPERPFVPDSCCQVGDRSANCGLKQGRILYEEGCVPKIEKAFKNNIVAVAAVAITILVIEIVGFIFACLLMRTIKAQYEVV